MYSLNQGKTFLHLTEDLNLIEFGSGNVCFRAQAPFQLDWTGIPVTPDNMNKQITVTENEIHISPISALPHVSPATPTAALPRNTHRISVFPSLWRFRTKT